MARQKMRERRPSITSKIKHKQHDGTEKEFFLTFGVDHENSVREVFCADPQIGSDIHAIITDACILISIYLQTGGEPERLVKSLGENRSEGEKSGPASSILGAIARTIVDIQAEVNEGKYLKCPPSTPNIVLKDSTG
jgi:hypothetical protein